MRRVAIVGALLVALPACVHVPNQAPALSRELGSRVAALRAAHLATIRAYFDAKREHVDRFVQDEWIPAYAKNVLDEPAIQKILASAQTPADRVEVLVGLGQRIQRRIDQRRAEMMRPLDDLERELARRVEAEYDGVTASNAAITALLDAHAETTSTQEGALGAIHVDRTLAAALDKVEKVVGLMTAGKDAFEENEAAIKKVIESLRE
ncbi:hypothetical protein [Anaeromyxobacter sp. Fw109-5]|uniref:hypothetical protein n=1 Tax=Anaeromyxobacter sp. (strain Fw109-5) TaxID=404589 RepID=UPI0000ED6E77|nr:hypothetical protein [Anaeromyxobacter sp. Fw109-5]ABS28184.1 hypothetical protein Anae109_4006 [Anaeromyxobacter sp. Fw109-5]